MSTAAPVPPPSASAPAPTGRSRRGLVALILGIVALVLAFVPFASYVAWLVGIAAIVVGVLALLRRPARKGAGIAGIVLGALAVVVSLVMSIVYTAIFVLASAAGSATPAPSRSADAGTTPAPASSAPAEATPSADAAGGDAIEGTGYRYSVPEDWGVPTGVSKPSGTDSFAADLGDKDGFADNLNVIVLNTGTITPAQAEAQGPAGLKQIGATKVTVDDRVRVAGESAAHLTAALTSSGAKYRVEQFYLPHDGKTYVVTFSFSPTVSKSDRADVFEPVLAGWDWS